MISRTLLFTLCLVSVLFNSKAQELVDWNDSLKIYERKIAKLGTVMLDDSLQSKREQAAKKIIPLFRKALATPGSFQYTFDSLPFMSKLKSPDNRFRIYTWILKLTGNRYRYFGVIHMAEKDSFVYHPLFDRSVDVMAGLVDRVDPNSFIIDSIYPNNRWFGMYYYQIGMVKQKKWLGLKTNKYYILTGWDGNNNVSHKKIIDVLSFEDGKAVFGAPLFKINHELNTRHVLEYNAQAVITLKYYQQYKLASFDDLVPTDPKNEGNFFTYIPSGSYDYFIWRRGKFIFKEDLFNTFKRKIE